MLYRIRFDNAVGSILHQGGITSTREKLGFWPAGESVIAIEIGKQLGLKPNECALIAIDYVYSKKRDAGEISENLRLPCMTPPHLFEKSVEYYRLRNRNT